MKALLQTGRLRSAWQRLRHSERGQGLVEYALIIVVVSLGTIASLTFLRGEIRSLFSRAGSALEAGGGTGGVVTPPGNNTGTAPNSGTSVGNPSGTANGLPQDVTGTPCTPNPGSSNCQNDPIFVRAGGTTAGPTGFAGYVGVYYGAADTVPPGTYMVTLTQNGVTKQVRGCKIDAGGYYFEGIWLRSATGGDDWHYNGVEYDWGCVEAPAFTWTASGQFTSTFSPPTIGTNGTQIDGVDSFDASSGNSPNFDTNSRWFNANTNNSQGTGGGATANSNVAGVWNTSQPSSGGTAPWMYYPASGRVWICTWGSTTGSENYRWTITGNNDYDEVCR